MVFSKMRAPDPSPAFDVYWKFAAERQRVFYKKFQGDSAPWTDDPIISIYKFTNAYRASDRVSQYLIGEVIEKTPKDASAEDLFLRIVLFKIFNKERTWDCLIDEFGDISTKTFSVARMNRVLDKQMNLNNRIYSAAYIIPPVNMGMVSKHHNHLLLIEKMLKDDLPEKIRSAKSLERVFHLILECQGIGPFLGFQYAIDLNYSRLIDFDENSFVVPGPGAKDGIRKCFTSLGDYSEADVIKYMTDRQEEEFKRLGISFCDLWGRKLHLIDCQNLFCEVDKYCRVALPHIMGISGRGRIKQKYSATQLKIDYSYPSKWGINSKIQAERKAKHPNGDPPCSSQITKSPLPKQTSFL
jgi:hypothetical protein